jgi:hypothetical protein
MQEREECALNSRAFPERIPTKKIYKTLKNVICQFYKRKRRKPDVCLATCFTLHPSILLLSPCCPQLHGYLYTRWGLFLREVSVSFAPLEDLLSVFINSNPLLRYSQQRTWNVFIQIDNPWLPLQNVFPKFISVAGILHALSGT